MPSLCPAPSGSGSKDASCVDHVPLVLGGAGRRIARALYALTAFVGAAVVAAPVFAFLIWRRHDPTWWLAFLVLWGVAATMAFLIHSVLRSMKAQNVHAAQLERLDALLRLLGLR